MSGAVFIVGQQKTRPGVYVRVTNNTAASANAGPQGTVMVLFRSSWGPLNVITKLSDEQTATSTFGSGGTTDAVIQAIRSKCKTVKAYRMGTGGTGATVTLQDTTPADAVKLTLSIGTDGNGYAVTVRDSLIDDASRELLIYNGTTLVKTIPFAKGTGEPDAIVAAVNSAGLSWITATKIADGSGTLAIVNQVSFSGGTDPTVSGTDYSNALSAIATTQWDVLAIDSEDPSIHATVQAFIDGQRDSGNLVLGVVGEPTSVPLATRQSDSQAFNDFAMHYVLNGFVDANGAQIQGYKAAARVAGLIAAGQLTDSLTHEVIPDATDIVGPLANDDIEDSELAGALVFTFNSQDQVQIDYGINTYTKPDADHDDGWKKIRRVRTRDYLISSIVAAWDPLVGKLNNDSNGRATLISNAQTIINQMIKDDELIDGTISEDKSNPASGDSAWFVVAVDDYDSAEKLYINFGFEFAPQTAS
ncbi:hypothetical protein AAC03nite_20140 [Alicyclobacillus acidoterrestris]|nr:hypothetical protein AAC03nite_20140 [Alicyclobacillus acidoterrestris]